MSHAVAGQVKPSSRVPDVSGESVTMTIVRYDEPRQGAEAQATSLQVKREGAIEQCVLHARELVGLLSVNGSTKEVVRDLSSAAYTFQLSMREELRHERAEQRQSLVKDVEAATKIAEGWYLSSLGRPVERAFKYKLHQPELLTQRSYAAPTIESAKALVVELERLQAVVKG